MRDIDITAECQEFIESLNERADEKFDYVLQIMLEVKVVSKEILNWSRLPMTGRSIF